MKTTISWIQKGRLPRQHPRSAQERKKVPTWAPRPKGFTNSAGCVGFPWRYVQQYFLQYIQHMATGIYLGIQRRLKFYFAFVVSTQHIPLLPQRTLLAFHKGQCVLSTKDTVCFPQRTQISHRTLCVLHKGHSVFSTKDNACFSNRTMCVFHKGQCVLSTKDTVCFPQRTMCAVRKRQGVLSTRDIVFSTKDIVCFPQGTLCAFH